MARTNYGHRPHRQRHRTGTALAGDMNPPAAAASTGGGGHAAPPAAAPAYAPYPRLSPDEVAPPPPPPYHAATAAPSAYGGNPYISSPAGSAATAPKNTMDSVKDVLGKMGKRFGEAARKTETITGNFWQHLKTGPSITDAAMSRISQVTKVIAEGGYDKIFHQTFEVAPSEKLKKPYACYLSTSAGPVMGVLYLSNVKLAFCSDNPLAYQVGDKTEWSYYKETEEGLKLEEKAPVPEKQGALEDTPQAEENKENKDATANEEEEKEEDKSVSINEFLKPAEGERYYGGRGRGRGRGDRGGFRGGYGGGYHAPPAAPAIQDQSQFPSLGGK